MSDPIKTTPQPLGKTMATAVATQIIGNKVAEQVVRTGPPPTPQPSKYELALAHAKAIRAFLTAV